MHDGVLTAANLPHQKCMLRLYPTPMADILVKIVGVDLEW